MLKSFHAYSEIKAARVIMDFVDDVRHLMMMLMSATWISKYCKILLNLWGPLELPDGLLKSRGRPKICASTNIVFYAFPPSSNMFSLFFIISVKEWILRTPQRQHDMRKDNNRYQVTM